MTARADAVLPDGTPLRQRPDGVYERIPFEPKGQGDALLRTVLIDPADDLTRLAYADWLEEEGRAGRAGYIRGQVRLGHIRNPLPETAGEPFDPEDSHRPNVTDITGLHNNHPEPMRRAERWYSRGLVWRVALPCEAFMRHAGALFANHPIAEVELTDRRCGGRAGLAAWREADRLFTAETFPFAVPSPVFRHLPRRAGDSDKWRDYDEAGEGVRALSAACVAYGRWLAGLPAI